MVIKAEEQQSCNIEVLDKQLNLNDIEDDDEANKILEMHRYTRFNSKVINSPPVDITDAFIHDVESVENGATYNYLLTINSRDLFKVAKRKRDTEYEKLCAEFALYSTYMKEVPIGKTLWLSEIAQFESYA